MNIWSDWAILGSDWDIWSNLYFESTLISSPHLGVPSSMVHIKYTINSSKTQVHGQILHPQEQPPCHSCSMMYTGGDNNMKTWVGHRCLVTRNNRH